MDLSSRSDVLEHNASPSCTSHSQTSSERKNCVSYFPCDRDWQEQGREQSQSRLLLGEKIVSDSPLVAAVGSKELGASQVENAEPVESLFALDLLVALLGRILSQHLHLIVFPLVRILGLQPVFARLCVVVAVDPPTVFERHVLLKVLEEVEAGHGSAAEEVLRHPAVVLLEMVRRGSMAEDVDEQTRFGPIFEPRSHLLEEQRVVFHVFEHFDAEDAVEGGFGEVVRFDVARVYFEVLESAFGRDRVDVDLLRSRVGQSADARFGIPFGQKERQRTPTASQIQDILTILQPRLFAVRVEHGLLGLIERLPARLVEAARVLDTFAQAAEHETGVDLVVLLVGLVLFDGDLARFERADVLLFDGDVLAKIVFGFGETADALCVEHADGPTQNEVGQVAAVEQLVDLIHFWAMGDGRWRGRERRDAVVVEGQADGDAEEGIDNRRRILKCSPVASQGSIIIVGCQGEVHGLYLMLAKRTGAAANGSSDPRFDTAAKVTSADRKLHLELHLVHPSASHYCTTRLHSGLTILHIIRLAAHSMRGGGCM